LDGWVRYEANLREQEQKKLAAQVIEKVTSALSDPKFVCYLPHFRLTYQQQSNILQQTLIDFDKISALKA
jgi:F-type H+-transporting ATPase subunit b